MISSLNSLLLNLLGSLNSSSLQRDLYLLGINELSVGPTFMSCLSGLKFSLNMLWALSC